MARAVLAGQPATLCRLPPVALHLSAHQTAQLRCYVPLILSNSPFLYSCTEVVHLCESPMIVHTMNTRTPSSIFPMARPSPFLRAELPMVVASMAREAASSGARCEHIDSLAVAREKASRHGQSCPDHLWLLPHRCQQPLLQACSRGVHVTPSAAATGHARGADLNRLQNCTPHA